MFNLKKIDTYKDGGTIAINCVMSVRWKEVKWLEDRQGEVIEICIDGRFGKDTLAATIKALRSLK